MSRGNASTISSTPQRCDGPTEDETARETFLRNVRERNAKLAEHTAKVDTPLQSDPIGNALPGLVGGAVVGGVAAAAGGGIRHIAGHIAEHAAKDIAAELVEHGAHHVVHELTPHGHKISEAHEDAMPFGPPPPPAAKSNNRAEPAKAPAAGRTGAAGTCEPAERPGECNSEPPIGQDRMPYAPGRAPLRIPEAPREETVERPVMVAG